VVTEFPSLEEFTDQARDGRPEPVSDADLVQQLIGGSEEALAGIYDRHVQAVYAAAMRTSRDGSIAAEVVQDTFLALWNRAEQFDPERGSLPAWLARIARNRAIDRLRANSRHDRSTAFSSFDGIDADDGSTVEWLMASGQVVGAASPDAEPETAMFDKEMRASIDDALGVLPPLERCVILLAYHAGLSHSEIATRLGWPLGTVKTRTRRALRHLRDRMEQTAGPTGSAAGARPARPSTAQGRDAERSIDWWDPRTWCPDLAPGNQDRQGSNGRRVAPSH
jgi:RNA polymerase sigma-70 factor (ECF subfamily)